MSTSQNNAEAAARFASVAQEFCSVIDSAPNLDTIELLMEVYRILPRLISEAVNLPNMELSEDESQEEDSRKSQARARLGLSEAQWGKLYEFLKAKLGHLNL